MYNSYHKRHYAMFTALFLLVFSCEQSIAAEVSSANANYDLSSVNATASSFGSAEFQTATITVGGQQQVVTADTPLTPAQIVAVNQVVAGKEQTIVIGAQGNAIGGTVYLHTDAGSILGSLNIPTGVTVVNDFALAPILNISGTLNNAGSFYAFASVSNILSATINAANIINQPGAIFSTSLPSTLGLVNASPQMALNLNVTGNLINGGTIASLGNLNIIAGGIIQNGIAGQLSACTATIQALNNVNLQSSQIINSGLIAAMQGNLNLSGLSGSNLAINNNGGSLSSLMGAINAGDTLFCGKSNLSIIGGDLLANQVNLFAGTGLVSVDVKSLAGVLNINAAETHIKVASNNLQLGNIQLQGDPTFYNSAGDVSINGSLVLSGAPLAIVASRNILVNASIDTSSVSGNGGHILMVAGADFASDGPASNQSDSTSTLLITGPSISGGKIDFTGMNPAGSINTSSSLAGGNGGNLTLVAFQGIDIDSGSITMPATVSLTTGGSQSGINGNVIAIAGATGGTAINIGSVDTSGGDGGGGVISLSTATPIVSTGGVSIKDGSVLSGYFTAGDLQQASIVTGSLTATGTLIAATAGNNLSVQSIDDSGISSGGSGGNVSMTAGGDMTFTGTHIFADATGGTQNGGLIVLKAASLNVTGASPLFIVARATDGGNGGIVLITIPGSTSDLTVGAGSGNLSIDVQGGSIGSSTGVGGKVLLEVGRNLTVDPSNLLAGPRGINGNGATLGLIAGYTDPANYTLYNLVLGRPGKLVVSSSINADGVGTGNGGMVWLMSGSPSVFEVGGNNVTNGVNGNVSVNSGAISGSGGILQIINFIGGVSVLSTTNLSVKSTFGSGGTMSLFAANPYTGLGAPMVLPSMLSADAAGLGNGGGLGIYANGFSVIGNNPLTLNANAAGSGAGGIVGIVGRWNNGDLVVGHDVGQVQLNAHGGSANSLAGDGGHIIVIGSGNVTVDPSAMAAGPLGLNGKGAWYTLVAGQNGYGDLLVSSSLDATGVGSGAGGIISLVSNSYTPFTVGSQAEINGVQGNLSVAPGSNSVTPGSIEIYNFNGAGLIRPTVVGEGYALSFALAPPVASTAGALTVDKLSNFQLTTLTSSFSVDASNSAMFASTSITLQTMKNALGTSLTSTEVFGGGSMDEATAAWGPDTEVKIGNNSIHLSKGSVMAHGGKQAVNVYVNGKTVVVAAGATAEVDVREGHALLIRGVGGSGAIATFEAADGSQIIIANGEQLIVADHALSDEELIDSDGNSGVPVSGSLRAMGQYTYKRQFNPADYIAKTITVAGVQVTVRKLNSFSPVSPHKATPKNLGNSDIQQNLPINHNAPIAYVAAPLLAPQCKTAPLRSSPQASSIFTDGQAKFEQSATGDITLSSGAIMLELKSGKTIHTSLVDILAKKNTAVSVKRSAEGTVIVRSLGQIGDLELSSGDTMLVVHPGQELILHSDEVINKNQYGSIARRLTKSYPLHNHLTATISDFSIASMIQSAPEIRELLHSPAPDAKHILAKILKTAVAVDVATASRGRYTQSGW